jgi:hypothetical protein
MIRKADTDYLRYLEACQRGLVVPLLPADFRRLTNRPARIAFRVAERAMQRAVATLMRRLADKEMTRSDVT